MYNITIIGAGYVGLITGVGLADFGNHVFCTDINAERIKQLRKGVLPIYEPGLYELFYKNSKEKRIEFTTNIKQSVRKSDIIFITVGTPPKDDGSVDLTSVIDSINLISEEINDTKKRLIVIKSTVPVGTNLKIRYLLLSKNKNVEVVSNPEFLREGKAVHDFFNPDRIVIGTSTEEAKKIMKELYRPLNIRDIPIIFCKPEEAELIKYACNSFLAMKITFINEMANLCDAVNADIHVIAKAIGMDGRIGPKFLHPGPGYGGSCFPKDTKALVKIGENYGVDMKLVEQVIKSNENQEILMVKKLKRLLDGEVKGKKIAILGLAFKAETDDVRESPAISIIREILKEGGMINAHDPEAVNSMKKIFSVNKVHYYNSEYDAVKDADAVVILTEWNQYRNINLSRVKSLMRGNVILDTRNILNVSLAKSLGFKYEGVGRK